MPWRGERHARAVDQDLGDRAAEAADHVVLLDRQDRAGLGGRRPHLGRVERLDRVHVDDPRLDAVRRQARGRIERRADLGAGRDDREVAAVAQADGAAEDEIAGTSA